MAPAGPIADFEPLAGVLTHARLDEIVPSLDRRLDRMLGARHFVDRYDPCGADPGPDCGHWPKDGMTLWARDYAPIYVRRADGRLKIVSTLSANPNRTHDLEVAERTPSHPLFAMLHPAAGVPTPEIVKLPLLHENGNLVTDGRHLFVSERLIEDNTTAPRDRDIEREGFRVRTRDEVLSMWAAALERPVSQVVVLPQMPGEQAGHVDMFLMALDADTLLVPEIPPEALRVAIPGVERKVAFEAASFLSKVVAELQAQGFFVERLPMLPAQVLPAGDNRSGSQSGVYVSPTNALLLSLGGERRVLLPQVRFKGRPAAQETLRRKYERAWATFFAQRGWTPEAIDVTEAAVRRGLVRCLTSTVPEAAWHKADQIGARRAGADEPPHVRGVR